MRLDIRCVALLATVSMLLPLAAGATTFSLSSSLNNLGGSTSDPDGTTVGMVTIDTITGTVTGIDVTYIAGQDMPFGLYRDTFVGTTSTIVQGPYDSNEDENDPGFNDSYSVSQLDASDDLFFELDFTTPSLIGYTGGQLCDAPAVGDCSAQSQASFIRAPSYTGTVDNLYDITFTPEAVTPSAVPEPPSFALLVIGLLGVARLPRKRSS